MRNICIHVHANVNVAVISLFATRNRTEYAQRSHPEIVAERMGVMPQDVDIFITCSHIAFLGRFYKVTTNFLNSKLRLVNYPETSDGNVLFRNYMKQRIMSWAMITRQNIERG